MTKKGTLKIKKSEIEILVLNLCSISAVFQIVRLSGDQKTALTGDSLYSVAELIGHETKHIYLHNIKHFLWHKQETYTDK